MDDLVDVYDIKIWKGTAFSEAAGMRLPLECSYLSEGQVKALLSGFLFDEIEVSSIQEATGEYWILAKGRRVGKIREYQLPRAEVEAIDRGEPRAGR